jgi:alcohol dehydrogenase
MAETAMAAVLTEPRKFDYRDYPIPDIKPDEGVLKVEAAGLCGTDYEQYNGHLTGTKWDIRPIIPGHEILGWIDRLGREAAKEWGVKEGDRVTVEASIPCGQCFQCQLGRPILCKSNTGYGLRQSCNEAPHLWGGYATHMYLHPRVRMHRVPAEVPAAAMSLFNPLANAVRWALDKPGLKVGNSIVIEGPGQRGLLSVFAAKVAGAGQIIITGTKADKGRLALAKELGAHAAICVDEEDPVARVLELTGGAKVDIVLDVAATSTEPIVQAVEMVRPGGTIVLAGLKNFKAVEGLVTDKIVSNEIAVLGVLSSTWTATETSIAMLKSHWRELEMLCTHTYPIGEADKALRVLGREIVDGREAVHVNLDTTRA